MSGGFGREQRASPKAKGTRGQLVGSFSGGPKVEPPGDQTPTLREKKLDKKRSAFSHKLAEITLRKIEKIETV